MNTVIHNPEQQKIFVLGEGFYPSPTDKDKFYPGCTTILDVYPKGHGFQQFLKDVGNNANEIVERAGQFGSKIHASTELLNNGGELTWIKENGEGNFTLDEWKCLLRYYDFWQKINPVLLANELKLCSDKLRYGVTIDRVVKINGRMFLIDIKTSNYIHKSHELQLAANAIIWNEFNPNNPIDRTAVLWLKANIRTDKIDFEKDVYQGVSDAGSWQLKTFDRHYSEAFKIFQMTQAIWEEENPNYKPANKILPDRISLNPKVDYSDKIAKGKELRKSAGI